jgi:hypothetical protein
VPDGLPPEQAATIERQMDEAWLLERHGVATVPSSPVDLRGLRVTTMGRTQQDDPAFFSASFAAGTLAAKLLDEKAQG